MKRSEFEEVWEYESLTRRRVAYTVEDERARGIVWSQPPVLF